MNADEKAREIVRDFASKHYHPAKLMADIATAITEAEKAALERAWQPIETAPKDGTKVLLGRFVGRRHAHREGRIRVDWWRSGKEGDGYVGFGEFNPQHWPATHWMPLPAPPLLPRPKTRTPDNEGARRSREGVATRPARVAGDRAAAAADRGVAAVGGLEPPPWRLRVWMGQRVHDGPPQLGVLSARPYLAGWNSSPHDLVADPRAADVARSHADQERDRWRDRDRR